MVRLPVPVALPRTPHKRGRLIACKSVALNHPGSTGLHVARASDGPDTLRSINKIGRVKALVTK